MKGPQQDQKGNDIKTYAIVPICTASEKIS